MRSHLWRMAVAAGVALLLLSVAGAAVAGEMLSLRQALILGLQNNFDLRAAQLDLPVADAAVADQAARFDLQSEASFVMNEQKVPLALAATPLETTAESRTMRGEVALAKQFALGTTARIGVRAEQSDADLFADRLDPANRATLVLDLTQPLLQGFGSGVNTADLQTAEARREQVALGYLSSAQQLVRSIEQAYLDLALAKQTQDFRQQSRQLADELLIANQRKLDAGLIPVSEVNEAKTALAGREEALIGAQQVYEIALNALRDLVAHDPEVPFPTTPELDPLQLPTPELPQLNDALEIARQARPDLRQALLEREVRRLQRDAAANRTLPQLDLQASLNVSGLAGDDPAGTWQGGWGDAFSGATGADGSDWSVGLQFRYPIGNRAARARKVAAEAEQDQARYRYRRLEVAAETEIRNALIALQRGEERLAVADRFVALAETTLDQENRRLKEGLSDSFRLLQFQDALIEARIRRATALTEYRKGLAQLNLATGRNLDYYDITAVLPMQGAQP